MGKSFPLNCIYWKNKQVLMPFVADVNATTYDSHKFFPVVDGIPLCFIVCLKADGIALLYTLVDVITNVWQIKLYLM